MMIYRIKWNRIPLLTSILLILAFMPGCDDSFYDIMESENSVNRPAINEEYFPNTEYNNTMLNNLPNILLSCWTDSKYWTSTTWYWTSEDVLYENIDPQLITSYAINFDDGLGSVQTQEKNYYVRCVRGGTEQAANDTSNEAYHSILFPLTDTGETLSYTGIFGEDHDYLDPDTRMHYSNPDNLVTMDTVTGLTWSRCTLTDSGADTSPECTAVHGKYTYASAVDACDNLDLAGQTDWRLPNMPEMQSIINYGKPSSPR